MIFNETVMESVQYKQFTGQTVRLTSYSVSSLMNVLLEYFNVLICINNDSILPFC